MEILSWTGHHSNPGMTCSEKEWWFVCECNGVSLKSVSLSHSIIRKYHAPRHSFVPWSILSTERSFSTSLPTCYNWVQLGSTPWLINCMWSYWLQEPLHSYDRGNSEARSRRKDCQWTLRKRTGSQRWKEGPFSSALLFIFWFDTTSKNLASSAYRVTGAGAIEAFSPQDSEFHPVPSREIFDLEMNSLSVSCRMDKKFLSSSCASDPSLQSLQ